MNHLKISKIFSLRTMMALEKYFQLTCEHVTLLKPQQNVLVCKSIDISHGFVHVSQKILSHKIKIVYSGRIYVSVLSIVTGMEVTQ